MSTGQARGPDSNVLLWIGEVGRLVLGFLVYASLTRAVSPEVLGTYLSLTSIVLLAPRLLDFGLPHAFGYFLRLHPQGLRSAARLIARQLIVAAIPALLIAYGLRFMPFANDDVARLSIDHVGRVALYILSELFILLGLSVYLPSKRFRNYLASTLTPPLALITFIVAWPRADLSPGRLLDLLLVASLCGSAAMVFGLLRARQEDPVAMPAREVYSFGLRSFGAGLTKVAGQRFDRLFLVTVLGAAGYADYSLAISIRDIAIFPATLFSMTLRNRQMDLVMREADLRGARSLLLRSSGAWFAISLIAAAVLYPVWPVLVRIAFGTAFLETADFLRVLSFSCGPLAIVGFAWNHLYALKSPGRVTALTFASLVVALPTYALSIHLLGSATGVSVAVVIWAMVTAGGSFIVAMASQRRTVAAP